MRRAGPVRRRMALLAAVGALGVGMNTACGQGPSSADYFPSGKALRAAERIRRGDAEGLAELIAGGLDADARGRDGADLLKWSMVWSCPECFRTLLENGAAIERPPAGEYRGKVDQVLLMPTMELAASAEDPAYLSLLLRHGGDPDALDVYGHETIIHAAILNGRFANVRLLAEAGADIHARDGSLATPLHLAVGLSNYDIAHYLLERGADPMLEDRWGYSVVDRIRLFKDRGAHRDDETYGWYVKVVERLGLDLDEVTLPRDPDAATRP